MSILRKRLFRSSAILIVLVLLVSNVGIAAVSGADEAALEPGANYGVIAEIEPGKVLGRNEDGIYMFKGIPYAKADRWEMPVKPQAWSELLNAQYVGPVSPQSTTGSGEYLSNPAYYVIDWSEQNFLNLNVWTPSMEQEAKKPVIVWIHGGGYTSGSSNELLLYDGKNLSEFGDAVIVSVNHRLNYLGYGVDLSAYGDEFKYSANAGHADLIMALEWVRDNITTFGGDASNVTIMGQSGGSSKVCQLMAMPAADGLFSKVIAMSSGSYSFSATKASAMNNTATLIRNLGLEGKPNEEIIETLQSMPYEDLAAACATARISSGAVVDNEYVMPNISRAAGKIDLMVGSVMGEMISGSATPYLGSYRNDSIMKSEAVYYNNNRFFVSDEDIYAKYVARYGANADTVIAAFRKAYPGHDLYDGLYTSSRNNNVANNFTNAGGTAYQYVMSYTFPLFGGIVPWHTGDLALFFRTMDTTTWFRGDEETADKVSRDAAGAVISFARTGNPSQDGLDWPAFTDEEKEIMVFDRESAVRKYADFDMDFQALVRSTALPNNVDLDAARAKAEAALKPGANYGVIAQIEPGKVLGRNEDGIYMFKGIPYAKADRWEMPVKPQAWSELLNAQYVGPVSPQSRTGSGEYLSNPAYYKIDWSEQNFLNLNVWTPSMEQEAKKPVIVWIHGGGYASGSSNELLLYDGKNLSEFGDSVIVSVNHRLNYLGYGVDLSAYGDEFKYSANAGHADLIMALEWVRDNITAFGGDASNVTIMGQSGGSTKVTQLMAMPAADGLFDKVIAMSSGSYSFGGTKAAAMNNTATLIRNLGLEGKPNEEIIETLQTMPYLELADACAAARISAGATVDNEYVLPNISRAAGKVDLMVGSCIGEMTSGSSTPYLGSYRNGSIIKNEAAYYANCRTYLTDEDIVNRYITRFGSRADAVMDAFRKAYPDHDLYDGLYTVSRNDNVANSFTAAGGTAYQYLTAYQFPLFGGILAWHTGDLPLYFRTNDTTSWFYGDKEVADKVSSDAAGAIISFARTGNPSQEDLEWPVFTQAKHETMIFDRESQAKNYHDRNLQQLLSNRAVPVVASVSVSTPTIVETLAANLAITVSGQNLAGEKLTAYLKVGDDLLYPTDVSSGTGRMAVANAPENGVYSLVVLVENWQSEGACDISVVPYNTGIWEANAYKDGGKLLIKFNENLVLKSAAKCVTIESAGYDARVLEDKQTVEVLGVDADALQANTAVVIKGVKYPTLFPSYSFTFTVRVP